MNITGVTLNPEAIETAPGVACLAVVRPYATWAPTTNSSSAQPTTSPVPPYVEGAIDFSIINESPDAIDVPWLIGIYNPLYTEVLQVSVCLGSLKVTVCTLLYSRDITAAYLQGAQCFRTSASGASVSLSSVITCYPCRSGISTSSTRPRARSTATSLARAGTSPPRSPTHTSSASWSRRLSMTSSRKTSPSTASSAK